MPTYTLQHNMPWIDSEGMASTASLASDISDVPSLPNLRQARDPFYNSQSQQYSYDSRQPSQQPRQPVFQQVRSMLQPRRALPPNAAARWDPYSGELSDNGRAPQVQPSKYKPPQQFEVRRRSLERRVPSQRTKSSRYSRSVSPVSMLRPEEMDYNYRPSLDTLDWRRDDDGQASPVSPVSTIGRGHSRGRSEASADLASAVVMQPVLPVTPVSLVKVPKRKPVSTTSTPSPAAAAYVHQRSITPERDTIPEVDESEHQKTPDSAYYNQQNKSHFSWTTYAASVAPSQRQTMEPPTPDMNTPNPNTAIESQPSSRFSWSTVATGTTQHSHRPDSPPPSPPPPVPLKYKAPPIQSILSRQRPVPRSDANERDQRSASATTPTAPALPTVTRPASPPSRAVPIISTRRRVTEPQPRSAKDSSPDTPTAEVITLRIDAPRRPRTTSRSTPAPISSITSTTTPAGTKRLPPPPPSVLDAELTHLDGLLRSEQDKIHQRLNIERLIFDLTNVEFKSPLDVSFLQVKEAKKKLEELRITLDEVKLEEREIGIAISRARRKEEGGEEGLWVRRVMGK